MMMCPIHPSFIHPFIHHRHDTGMVLHCNARDGYDRGVFFFFLSGGEFIGSNGIATFYFYFCACAGGLRSGRDGGRREALVICIL